MHVAGIYNLGLFGLAAPILGVGGDSYEWELPLERRLFVSHYGGCGWVETKVRVMPWSIRHVVAVMSRE